MNEGNSSGIHKIPTEILEQIFELLSPTFITTCRGVCRRWQQVVDYMAMNETLWRKYCELNYSDICHSAYKQSIPGLSWFNLYKSLTLWAKLSHAQVTINEVCFTMDSVNLCINCQVLSNRIVGVLRDKSLDYYNIDTLQQLQELTISNDKFYYSYRENDDVILLLNTNHELSIRRKEKRNETVNTFDKVYLCDIIENDIYYVTFSNIIYKLTYVNGSYMNIRLESSPDFLMSFGHQKGVLYILTSDFNIYSYDDNTLRSILINGSCRDKFEGLRKYNFAKDSAGMYMQGLLKLYFCEEEKVQSNNLLMIHTHGTVLFAGNKNCTLRIFHSLYTTSVLDLLKTKPLKVLHLLKPYENKLTSKIMNIFVLEGQHGHIVIVAMTTKIVVIKFTHPVYSEEVSSSPEDVLGSSELEPISTKKLSSIIECSDREPSINSKKASTNIEESSRSSGESSPKIAKRSNPS